MITLPDSHQTSNHCHACIRTRIEPSNFCVFCGARQKPPPPPPPPPPKKPKKPKSKKPLFFGVGVIGLVLIAASIGGEDSPTATPTQTSNSSSTTSSAPEEPEPIAVPFSEVADSEVIADRASQTCSALGEIVVPDNNPSFFPSKGAIVIDEVARIERESTAKNYVSDNSSWINDDFLEGYRDSLRDAVQSQLDAAISDLGYNSSDFEIDQAQWSTGFLNKSIAACDLTDQRQETEDAISAFQDDVNRVIRLSK